MEMPVFFQAPLKDKGEVILGQVPPTAWVPTQVGSEQQTNILFPEEGQLAAGRTCT